MAIVTQWVNRAAACVLYQGMALAVPQDVCWACSAAWGWKSPAQPDGGEGPV